MNSRVLTLSAVLFALLTLALTGASAQEWKSNKKDTVTRLKNNNHGVGIGTNTPQEKLQVKGGVQYDGVKNVNGKESRNPVTLKRYHVEATKAVENSTVPLDSDLFQQLCRDKDGCLLTLGMRDWADDKPGLTASVASVRFYPSIKKGNMYRQLVARVDPNDPNAGVQTDGDGNVFNVLIAWDCYLTDGEWVDGSATDNQVGFGLLNFAGTYSDPDMVCVLTIED